MSNHGLKLLAFASKLARQFSGAISLNFGQRLARINPRAGCHTPTIVQLRRQLFNNVLNTIHQPRTLFEQAVTASSFAGQRAARNSENLTILL